MQSVRKDPSLAPYYNVEAFESPGNFELNLNCDADALAGDQTVEEDDASIFEDEYEDENILRVKG